MTVGEFFRSRDGWADTALIADVAISVLTKRRSKLASARVMNKLTMHSAGSTAVTETTAKKDDQFSNTPPHRWNEELSASGSEAETTDYDDANLVPQVLHTQSMKRTKGGHSRMPPRTYLGCQDWISLIVRMRSAAPSFS